ncbi:hypothetical protein [Bradyrhizobium prioriisuperbiae]|uniref:hypothetical protein n=1 Tax=Bradyrhizobium prioriisuperbiae TaxID=2854389 RepID=UPI0028E18E32|nr:hypothetical protein [Bradyrhizobium prioritasuperba]
MTPDSRIVQRRQSLDAPREAAFPPIPIARMRTNRTISSIFTEKDAIQLIKCSFTKVRTSAPRERLIVLTIAADEMSNGAT